MRRLYVLGYILIALATIATFVGVKILDTSGSQMTDNTDLLSLTSQVFEDNTVIPTKYTCKDKNISPPLDINGVPPTAASLALIMHDPDAPLGDFTHWLMWNIDSAVTRVEENNSPVSAVQGTNSFGNNGYDGPCPPSGTHHYIFELYALDTKLDLPATAGQTELKQAMQGHILDQTTLTGLFSASSN